MSDTALESSPVERSNARIVAALAALAASASCFFTCENLPVGLLPGIAGSMRTSLAGSGLLVTFYALTVVVGTVPLVRLTRHMPRRFLLAGVAAALALGCVGSALAQSFAELLAARIFTAGAQAIFWATGPVEAASLVSPQRRGRALSAVFIGSAAGQVLGLPAGTAIGHAAGWRVSFVALAAAAVILLVAILWALPTRAPHPPHADAEGTQDRIRYRVLILSTGLAVAANFAMFTFVAAFLVKVSGVRQSSVALVLLAAGAVSTLGLGSAGWLYVRHRRATIPAAIGFMLLSLTALFLAAKVTLVAVPLIVFAWLGQGIFTVAGMTAVIELKPSNGSAWYSTAYNVGIAAGPLAGGLALRLWGLRATPLAGVTIGLVALTLMVGTELRLRD